MFNHKGVPYCPDRPAERQRAGKPLADGLRAFLSGLKADLDHFAKDYGLRHYGSNEMCEFCAASRVGDISMRFNNFGSDAVWPVKQYSEAEWRALYKHRFLHLIFTLPGVSHFMVEPDELHVIYLGSPHISSVPSSTCSLFHRAACPKLRFKLRLHLFEWRIFGGRPQRATHFPCMSSRGVIDSWLLIFP